MERGLPISDLVWAQIYFIDLSNFNHLYLAIILGIMATNEKKEMPSNNLICARSLGEGRIVRVSFVSTNYVPLS